MASHALALDISISSTDGLQAALATATPGTVLLLEPGDYGMVEIRMPISDLTLRSANPADPAQFDGMAVKAATGLVMDGLRFRYQFRHGDNDPAKAGVNWPFQVLSSSAVTIRNSLFMGDLAQEGRPEDLGFPTATALVVRHTQGVELKNNRFELFQRGIAIDHSSDVVISGNEITALRQDGMNLTALHGAIIENNFIHDFKRSLASKDHADMIQFWTAGTTEPSRDITIRGNILNSGNGAYTQSIFMRNEMVDQGKAGREMFYQNILIEQNVIINGHLHGISIGETEGLVIRNNTLVHNRLSDGIGGTPELWRPCIQLAPTSDNVEITQNITSAINGSEQRADWRVAGNLLIQDRDPNDPGWYDDVFVNARRGDMADLASFAYLPGGPADAAGIGANTLRVEKIRAKAAGPVPMLRIMPDAHYVNRFRFDSSLSLLPAPADKASYSWDFDGIFVTGPNVQHDFPTPGHHRVELTLRLDSGQSVTARAAVDVPYPEVLRFDPNQGGLLVREGDQMALLPGVPITNQGRTIPLGQGQPAIAIDRNAVAGVFGAGDIYIRLRLRTVASADPAGEIFRIHDSMVLRITPLGQLEFQLFPSMAAKPVVVLTGPLHLHDGRWHDLEVAYDSGIGQIALSTDSVLRATGHAMGHLGPMRSWGLSLGNPFGQKSLDGEIATLDIRSNLTSFAK